MTTPNSISQMAAFATIKSLSDEKKYQSPYQLLSEFIRDIIIDKTLYSFHVSEMKKMLFEKFGFDIPEAVIKTTARKMTGISLSNGIYSVAQDGLGSHSLFSEKKKEADVTNANTIALLVEYVQERTGQSVWMDELTQELVCFLVGEPTVSGKYTDIIGEFVIQNENNIEIQDCLNGIIEGSIIYIGLNHNINEIGSITKPLTLYLGTEILFSLVGYNGTICQQLAADFYKQVCSANSGASKKIFLRYFSEIKKEIDDFFLMASEIVDRKRENYTLKPAMIKIVNGCDTSADVFVKQSDFYYRIQYTYGITEESTADFYDEEYFDSNLESFDYVDDDDKDNKKEIGIKYISHINKLRNGEIFANDIDSECLLITNTKATLIISKEQSDRIKEEHALEYVANFAMSLDRITSLLWYKLGNGFGNKDFPSSISAVLGARVILSASIAKNAAKAYFDIKKQYDSGNITKEQLAGRIITLKNKPKLPEELQGDDIAEIMDFSPDFLSRYEEEHKNNQKELEEKERILRDLRAESELKITEQDETINSQANQIIEQKKSIIEKESTIASQKAIIKEKDAELERYRLIEAESQKKKGKRKRICLFILGIIWKLLLVAILTCILVVICKHFDSNYASAIGLAVGILGIIPTIIAIVKKDLKKLQSKESEKQ